MPDEDEFTDRFAGIANLSDRLQDITFALNGTSDNIATVRSDLSRESLRDHRKLMATETVFSCVD